MYFLLGGLTLCFLRLVNDFCSRYLDAQSASGQLPFTSSDMVFSEMCWYGYCYVSRLWNPAQILPTTSFLEDFIYSESRAMERERQRPSSHWFTTQNSLNDHSWARPKPKPGILTKSPIWVAGPIFCCSPTCISRELNQKWSSWDWIQQSYRMLVSQWVAESAGPPRQPQFHHRWWFSPLYQDAPFLPWHISPFIQTPNYIQPTRKRFAIVTKLLPDTGFN